jgi:hypothetical protein
VVLPIVSDPHAVPIVVLYVGPDQIMPLTSAIGAIVGLALMFWNRIVGLACKLWVMFLRREVAPQKPSTE